jgi:hypothetical protein
LIKRAAIKPGKPVRNIVSSDNIAVTVRLVHENAKISGINHRVERNIIGEFALRFTGWLHEMIAV